MTDSHDPEGAASPAAGPAASPSAGLLVMDPVAVIRSRRYLSALLLADFNTHVTTATAFLTSLGVTELARINAARAVRVTSYGFLTLVTKIQDFLFDDLPQDVFEGSVPAWWPVPWLLLCGLLTALTIRYLPGNCGHSPALGFHVGGGPPIDRELPGMVLAAVTTLSLGAVLGLLTGQIASAAGSARVLVLL